MILRKFGMRFLNITQGRYGTVSHQLLNAYDLAGEDVGIDRFITFNPLVVIGAFRLKETGFANTVIFFDEPNNVSLAFTHMDSLDVSKYYVGRIFNPGETIYYEGSAGKATGKHIHLEIGLGRQPKKINISKTATKLWALTNLINIEDYFYIDKDYTTIIKSKGYLFKSNDFTGKPEGGDIVSSISGLKRITSGALDISIYGQKNKQKLGMISASKNTEDIYAVKTIDKLDDERIHYCKVNANYFQMGNSGTNKNGEHYGVEITPTTQMAPKQKPWLAMFIKKGSRKIEWLNSADFWYNRTQVDFAASPFLIMFHNGVEIDEISTATMYNGDKRLQTNYQTFIVQLKDNQILLGITHTRCYPKDILKWAKNYFGDTLEHLSLYDSGGSTQMIVNSEKIRYTGRALSTAFTLFKDDSVILWPGETTPKPVEPEPIPVPRPTPEIPNPDLVNIPKPEYDILTAKASKYDKIKELIKDI